MRHRRGELTGISLSDGGVRKLLKYLEEADADVPVLVLAGAGDWCSHDLALEMGPRRY